MGTDEGVEDAALVQGATAVVWCVSSYQAARPYANLLGLFGPAPGADNRVRLNVSSAALAHLDPVGKGIDDFVPRDARFSLTFHQDPDAHIAAHWQRSLCSRHRPWCAPHHRPGCAPHHRPGCAPHQAT